MIIVPEYAVSNTGLVMNKRSGKILKPGSVGKYLHVTLSVNNKQTQEYIHRLVADAFIQKESPNLCVDHIDGDTHNNNARNLRWVTTRQNGMNKPKQTRNKSGFKGVSWSSHRNKWHACIRIDRRTIHLGDFDTPEEAALIYEKKAEELFGEFNRRGEAESA